MPGPWRMHLSLHTIFQSSWSSLLVDQTVSVLYSTTRFSLFFYGIIFLYNSHSYREVNTDPLWHNYAVRATCSRNNSHFGHGWPSIGQDSLSVWVAYETKTISDCLVENYKLRTTKILGIHFKEIFALLAQLAPIRTLMDIAAIRRWQLFQLDGKTLSFMMTLKRKLCAATSFVFSFLLECLSASPGPLWFNQFS